MPSTDDDEHDEVLGRLLDNLRHGTPTSAVEGVLAVWRRDLDKIDDHDLAELIVRVYEASR